VTDEDIQDACAQIIATIHLSEYDEGEMAKAIFELHEWLNADQELYLCVWSKLDAPTRRMYKEYLSGDYSRTDRESGLIPPRYLREIRELERTHCLFGWESASSKGSTDDEC
jgi:hypothetical protein